MNNFEILNKLPDDINFLQIGVNDGQDHLTAFILNKNWKGIMVEPDTFYIRKAKEKYKSVANNLTWFQVAISNVKSTATMYKVNKIDKDWEKGIGSLDKSHVIKHNIDESNIISFEVKTVLLTDIVDKELDIWFIDAEGSERNILLGCDISTIKPKYIILETTHMQESDLNEIASELNYTPYWDKFDSLLIRN